MDSTTENATTPSTADQKPAENGDATPQAPVSETDTTPAATSDDSAKEPSNDQATTEPAADAAASTETAEPVAEAAAAAPTVVPRVVIITGASSGLGFEAAKSLCEAGHDVILACRNEEKTNRAIEKIRKQNQKAQATFLHVSKLVRGLFQP
jgi:short chain dehydrogenase